MAYKFEQLEVWQKALDYADQAHDIVEQLSQRERDNLSKDRGRRSSRRPSGYSVSRRRSGSQRGSHSKSLS